ncbi:hypothetical protein [Cellulomonas sp. PS-H5]|uniref:hypothetical protein n=1 Tax=Cellulomonas sp. PS-H5 TaxID=2820400 RepID=UPI001C4F1764|nr:hypothetical protein [Cellulomonas sp. PS-H5]MBW0252590.1 hypothetical protein [Cellulomonas sp. PS-H5]
MNTSEVLQVFALTGVPCDDRVMRAIRYINNNVRDHTRLRQDGGRGRNARFPIFALSGISQYAQSLVDPASVDTIEWCMDWLEANRVRDGWPELQGGGDTSIHQTANGLSAISVTYRRINEMTATIGEARAKRLRHQLAEIAQFAAKGLLRHRRPDGLWPPSTFASHGASPAKTALSILALRSLQDAGLDFILEPRLRETLPQLVEQSAIRLTQDHSRWEHYVESDPEVPGTVWQHPSYAMCLAATCSAGVHPGHRSLSAAWRELDKGWSNSARMWVEPGGNATIRAAFHATRAYFQVREAPLDGGAVEGALKPLVFQSALEPPSTVTIATGGHRFEAHLSPKMFQLAETLVNAPLGLQSREVASVLLISQGGVSRYIGRLNDAIGEQTNSLVTKFVEFDQKSGRYRVASG